jgi:calmodulin
MYKNKKEVDAEKEIRDAFKVFDKDGKGSVPTSELRAVLTSMGEKLSEEEVRHLPSIFPLLYLVSF